MGPCWLKVTAPTNNTLHRSWCTVEVTIDDMKKISIAENPPPPPTLTIMSIHLKTVLNHKSRMNEVAFASVILQTSGKLFNCFFSDKFLFPVNVDAPSKYERSKCPTFNFMRKLDGVPMPVGFDGISKNRGVQVCSNEKALLQEILGKKIYWKILMKIQRK